MAGPWENYQPVAAPETIASMNAPWEQYSVPETAKKPFGLGDTWPARLAKSIYSGVTLPGDVVAGKAQLPQSANMPGGEQTGDMSRVMDLATLASPAPPRVAASLAKPVVGAPSRQELLAAAERGYDTARGTGVEVAPAAVKQMGETISANLEQQGINGKLAPKTFSILSEISKPPPGSTATISNFETIRRTLGNAAKDFQNPTEQLAASKAIQHLDDYLANIPESAVVAGDAAAASKSLGEARGNYAAAKRSEQISDTIEQANLAAKAANSGANIGNATRQRIKSILFSDRKSSGYNADEIDQLSRVVSGTRPGNTARTIGNLLGGGGGLGAAVYGLSGASGAIASGQPGVAALAALPIAGYGFKKLSDASVNKQVRILDELIRSRSPLAESMAEQIGQQPKLSPSRQALIRALLESQWRDQGR